MVEAVRRATENMPSYNRIAVYDGVLYARSDMSVLGMPEDFALSLQQCLSEQHLPTIPATYFTTGARAREHTVRKVTIAGTELMLKKSRFSRKEIQDSATRARRFHVSRSTRDYFTELQTLFEAKRAYRQNPLPGSPELLTEEPLAVYAQSNGDYWTIFPYYPTQEHSSSKAYRKAEQLGFAQSNHLKQLGFHWQDPQFIIAKRADGTLEPRLIDFELLYPSGNIGGIPYTAHNEITQK